MAQCSPKVERIGDSAQSLGVPTGAELRTNEFVRYRRKLPNGDQIDLLSVKDGAPFGGYSERGLVIERDGHVISKLRLADLAELKPDPKDPDDDPSDSFRALALVQGCTPKGTMEAVSFQWEGDLTSPALLITISRTGAGYVLSSLPTISGGVFEISRLDARVINAWDNLHEGECEACSTHYEVRRYRIEAGRPIQVSSHKTRRKYTSQDWLFDDRTRVRLVP